MKIHSTRLPISESDRLLIHGKFDSYYECSSIAKDVALYLIKNHCLNPVSNITYARSDNNQITEVVSLNGGKYWYSTNKVNLSEVKRMQLVSLSKKDTKDRFLRRRTVKLNEVTYRSINFNKFVTKGILSFEFKIRDYTVTIEIDGIIDYFKKNLQKPTYKDIRKYISKAIDTNDIKIDCTCPDFIYRFAYTATIGGYKANSPENRPSKITNPKFKGSACKHLLYLLNNKQWIVKYVSFIDILLKIRPDILS